MPRGSSVDCFAFLVLGGGLVLRGPKNFGLGTRLCDKHSYLLVWHIFAVTWHWARLMLMLMFMSIILTGAYSCTAGKYTRLLFNNANDSSILVKVSVSVEV